MKFRVCHEFQGGEADRPDDSANVLVRADKSTRKLLRVKLPKPPVKPKPVPPSGFVSLHTMIAPSGMTGALVKVAVTVQSAMTGPVVKLLPD